jgi:hypothetical protein
MQNLGLNFQLASAFADRVHARLDSDNYIVSHRTVFHYAHNDDGLNMNRADAMAYADQVADNPDAVNAILLTVAANRNQTSASNQVEILFNLPDTWETTPANSTVFGNFVGSEGQVLLTYANERHNRGNFLSSVRIGSEYVDITCPPNTAQRGYMIHDPEIARALDIETGHTLTQEQVNQLPELQQTLISDWVVDPNKIEYVSEGMNPIYAERPIRADQQTYMNRIRDLVNYEISILNENAPGGIFGIAHLTVLFNFSRVVKIGECSLILCKL